MSSPTLSFKFTLTLRGGHGNKIWDKMGYNSASVKRYLRDVCILRGVGVGLSNTANKILPRPTLVAMAMKFETKGL